MNAKNTIYFLNVAVQDLSDELLSLDEALRLTYIAIVSCKQDSKGYQILRRVRNRLEEQYREATRVNEARLRAEFNAIRQEYNAM